MVQDAQDQRGVVPPAAAAQIRKLRSAEQWTRYDSVVIGPGASVKSASWYETWKDFADADELRWFSGHKGSVGKSYSNQDSERTDFAQDLYQSGVEMFRVSAPADNLDNALDALITPILFNQYLPNLLNLRVTLAESDDISRVPAIHMPSGFGMTNSVYAAQTSPIAQPGNQGIASVSNTFKWPKPIMLAAQAKLTVTGLIDSPLRETFQKITGPGNMIIPLSEGQSHTMPVWYVIRIFFRGPRFLQLRGARSAS